MLKKILGLDSAAGQDTSRELILSAEDFCSRLGLRLKEVETSCMKRLEELDSMTELPLSFHLLAFEALALSGFRPGHVLELGTFQGKATALLSSLFPQAKVYTVDLPKDDPIFRSFHEKISPDQERVERRLKRENIERIRINSAFVGSLDLPRFDLIWVDAGHHFPEVAWDHAYAFSRIQPEGWIFSDDIWLPSAREARKDLKNGQAFEMMDYLSKRAPCDFRLVPKRPSGRDFLEGKFIGYAKFGAAGVGVNA